MVKLSDIDIITTNTVLSTSQDTYLVDASSNNITITLPLITTEGIYYKIIRIDISTNIVIIQGSVPNLITENTSLSSASINLFIQKSIELQSNSNTWYITSNNTLVNFGSEYQYVQSPNVFQTTSTTFQPTITLNTPIIPAGRYRISWFYNWNFSATFLDFEARIVLDGSTVLYNHMEEPTVFTGTDTPGAQLVPASGFTIVDLTNGIHSILLEYRSSSFFIFTFTASVQTPILEIYRIA